MALSIEVGIWHYPLKWVYGDSISVYSPQASFPNSDFKYADYEIAWADGTDGEVASNNNLAYLVRTGENGLHWGDVHEEHTFYAFYPSKIIKDDDSFNNGVVDGYIPKYQQMVKWEKKTVKDENGTYTHWVGTPDMHLAFMRAEKKVKPDTIAEGHPLALDFKPLTTAVEVTLEAKEDMASAEVQMIHVRGLNKNKTQKQCIAGNFTYDIDQGKTTYLNQDIANDYEISVPLWASIDGGNPAPISLSKNDKVTFTVFLLPAEHSTADGSGVSRDLTNLQLEVIGFDGNSQIKTYEEVMIPQGTKSQVVLPKYEPKAGSLNNWMSRIPDNVYISQLTIPGAAEAFSAEIIGDRRYGGENQEYKFSQNLSVSDMFDKGVRAFDIGTRVGIYGITEIWWQSLGDAALSCGGSDGSSFRDAIDAIYKKVEKTDEFVVVTTYFVKNAYGWSVWPNQLNKFLKEENNDRILAYRSDMTVGEARGKILLMARANGTEANGTGLTDRIPVIEGWNSMKDKWGKRGYDYTNTTYFKDPNTDQVNQWLGNSGSPDKNPKDAGYSEPTNSTSWEYTAKGPGMSSTVYIQEWRRVCPVSAVYSHGGSEGQTYWFESYTEKVNSFKNFFTQAKTALKNKVSSSLYINSLDGYYVINNSSSLSGAPNSSSASKYGIAGNIVDYAEDINRDAYKHVLSVSYENRGPVGIVYFDFAGENTFQGKTMYGDYLLKTLIGNNFSFPLMGK